MANDIRIGNETRWRWSRQCPAAMRFVTFTPTGVLYTPPAGFIGTDTFTYQPHFFGRNLYPAATVT
ncbi:MAG: hypothetical protein R3C56_22795 [Pirellulaceae bacterium]